MKKVRLSVDGLQVQSFATSDAAAQEHGTVHAHDAATDADECATQDQAWNTCWGTCDVTCGCPDNTERYNCYFTEGPCDTYGSNGWNYWDSVC